MSAITPVARKIIHLIARTESGDDYSEINPNDNGAGISYGLIQFNQKKGSLYQLFNRMKLKDPDMYSKMFGPYSHLALLNKGIKNFDLNTESFKAVLKLAAKYKPFQIAQEEIAFEEYFLAAERLSALTGGRLISERAYAVLMDSCVQNGEGNSRMWLKQIMENLPAQTSEKDFLWLFVLKADAGKWAGDRREKLFNSPLLSDAPISTVVIEEIEEVPAPRTLMRGMRGEDVKALNKQLANFGFLPKVFADRDSFENSTFEAVRSFQDFSGITWDGVVGPMTREHLAANTFDFSDLSRSGINQIISKLAKILDVDVKAAYLNILSQLLQSLEEKKE